MYYVCVCVFDSGLDKNVYGDYQHLLWFDIHIGPKNGTYYYISTPKSS